MAKFFGKIGFTNTEEDFPGIWEELISEKEYFGEVVRNIRRLHSSGNVNDNVSVSNEISIIADPYAINNFHNIRYVEYLGAKWKVSSVEVQYPRLILILGEVYNDDCK